MPELPQVGDKLLLIKMDDDLNPISPGATGVVEAVSNNQIWVKWDKGEHEDRELAVLPDKDEWIIIPNFVKGLTNSE